MSNKASPKSKMWNPFFLPWKLPVLELKMKMINTFPTMPSKPTITTAAAITRQVICPIELISSIVSPLESKYLPAAEQIMHVVLEQSLRVFGMSMQKQALFDRKISILEFDIIRLSQSFNFPSSLPKGNESIPRKLLPFLVNKVYDANNNKAKANVPSSLCGWHPVFSFSGNVVGLTHFYSVFFTFCDSLLPINLRACKQELLYGKNICI